MNSSGGFTLLELLIVVIIVGILAAVAIPQFTDSADRSRESEGRAAIDALLTAQSAYYAERGSFISAATDLLARVPTMRNWRVPVMTRGSGPAVTVSLNGNTTAHNHLTHFLIGIVTETGDRTITNNDGA